MPTPYEKLSTLLKELFQLDQADLDFGIYRIMNQKRDEITHFLDQDLLPQVKAAFNQYRPADKKAMESALQKAIQGAEALGVDQNAVPKIKEIREQLASYSVDTNGLENEVYSHLYNFFRRYYDNGDFISMRRYKEGVYAIPYEGEEVKLHWANADQYYIKTSENFRDYSFRLPSGRLAHFKIVEAETEKDNVKSAEEKDRRFILTDENAVRVEEGALVMRFEYRADAEKRNQKTLNSINSEAIMDVAPADWQSDLKTPAPTESSPTRNLLNKHLSDYSARNTFDYFIHKDLHVFLRRELDFYIKNEVMRLDDIEDENAPRVEQYLSKIKVLRQVAHKIIEFLAQIEDFQKRLWLKKKFVVETNYCITLDLVPEEFYPEICANDAQRKEWVRLFAIDEIKKGLFNPGYSKPLTIEFLKANKFLVLDTRWFSRQFSEMLMTSIENVDEQMDGLLIHSENFQALNFIKNRFANEISCIYIDPPYNATSSEIIYKNNYKHSSWLSLIEGRLSLTQYLLKNEGLVTVAIDDYEASKLWELMNSIYGYSNHLGTVVIRNNPKGRMTKRKVSLIHEYTFIFGNSEDAIVKKLPTTPEEKTHNYKQDEDGSWYLAVNLRKQGVDSEAEKDDGSLAKRYYPIYYNPKTGEISPYKKFEIEIFPIDSSGNKRIWRRGIEVIETMQKNNDLWVQETHQGLQVYFKFRGGLDGQMVKSIWTDPRCSASDYGTQILDDILGKREQFSYPKAPFAVEKNLLAMTDSLSTTVLDFFAGSGTTGHATINLNREDGGTRKYILIEVGEYFNTVLKLRLQKVIYSKDWKDGKPVSREGSSHCFKYLRLESYEDTLNNLTLNRTMEQQLALEAAPEFKENYFLSYMLDVESKGSLLNTGSFNHPFDYQLNISTGTVGESSPYKVDLIETFNYLIGLHVETMKVICNFHVVTGRTPAGERTLVIWRDLEEKSNADLEEFFRKQAYNPHNKEFDLIYVNGDNNLENLRRPNEIWKVRLIEEDFLRLMFDTEEN